MQDKDLAALKALAEAATPGPWVVTKYGNVMDEGWNFEIVPSEIPRDDVQFIAAANPQAILSLISRIEQQAARIAELEAHLSRHDEAANNAIDAALMLPRAVDLSGLTRYALGAVECAYPCGSNHFCNRIEERGVGEYVKLTDVQALLAAPARDVGGLTESREAWEYSFIHSSAIGHGDSEIGPCLTYSREQAFGVGCLKQRRVFVSEVLATKEAEPVLIGIDYSKDYLVEVRNAALEEAAEKLESMNDSAGDRASYDNRDMTCCETERMHALMHAVEAIRALATSPAPSGKQELSDTVANEKEALRRLAVQSMADCMDMVRQDLIEMGIIDKSVAPMFIPEAIAAYVRRVAAPTASQGEVKVPEGFKLVPIAPTPAMLLAGVKGFQKAGYNDCDKLHDWAGCYAAMLAAAPSVTDGETK